MAKAAVPVPTGDNVLTHTFSDNRTVTFLRNAVEVLFDNIGNDNGLCESGETCLYTPNIWAYQWHGPLLLETVIGAGTTVTNVTLMKHLNNGR